MGRQIKHRTSLNVESLESRELPAMLVSPTTMSYQDVDGDDVRVVVSKPILTSANANSIFKFDVGSVDGVNALKQQLFAINLENLTAAAGTSVKLTATASKTNGGDGFAALGEITAFGIDLGAVSIDGDLGRFAAGDLDTLDTGLASLRVDSFGKFGKSTGAGTSSPGFSDSGVEGKLGSLFVQNDFTGAVIDMFTFARGTIGNITIGGSLVGGDDTSPGFISAFKVGNVKIGGSVIGGSGFFSGRIAVEIDRGTIGNVSIGGDVVGGSGVASGQIFAKSGMGSVKVGGDVRFGTQVASGQISSKGSMGSVTVGGNLAGEISANANMGRLKIAGDLAGYVRSGGNLAGATIGGGLTGYADLANATSFKVAGDVPGTIGLRGTLGSLSIGGDCPGDVGGKKIGTLTIAGDVTGGIGLESVGTLSIGGDVRTANGIEGGLLEIGDAKNVKIAGDVIGGTGSESGTILGGTLGNVTIGGSVIGGSVTGDEDLYRSGTIQAKRISSLVIGGSIIAGTNSSTGFFDHSGSVSATEDIGRATIGGLIGNSTHPAIISAWGQAKPSATRDMAIGALTIKGDVQYAQILGGYASDPILQPSNMDAQIGPVTVKGNWKASSIAAGAQPGDNGFFGDGDANEGHINGIRDAQTVFSKITSLTIGGQASGTVGGVDSFGIMAQSVGGVKIGGKAVALTSGKDNLLIAGTDDFRVKELS